MTGSVSRVPRAVAVGDVLQGRSVGPVTQTAVVRFAGAGGDFNPLHHDPDAARAAGFDRPIAMGQMQAGLLAAWVTDTFGVEHLRELAVRFTAPLRLGDLLELSGRVASVVPDGDQRLATLDLHGAVADVEVIRATAVVVVG